MTAPDGLRVTLWGTRGSLPVPGPGTLRHGANTIAIELRRGDAVLFVDAGSGIAAAGRALKAEGLREVAILLSHCHFDHLMGLPFFAPLYNPAAAVSVWSGHLHGRMTTREIVEGFMRQPYFPVGPDMFAARVDWRDFRPGEVLEPLAGVRVCTVPLTHPGGAVGYRVEWGGRSVAVATDVEHQPGTLDEGVLELMRGADLALYDAAYADAEMAAFRGWGHSSWQHGVRLAQAAGVARLGLIHHAEWREDDAIDAIEASARAEFPGAFCGADGQVITL